MDLDNDELNESTGPRATTWSPTFQMKLACGCAEALHTRSSRISPSITSNRTADIWMFSGGSK